MPDTGDIEPIIIKLGVDATSAAEAIAQFKRETKEGVEGATTTAVDRAKAKLDELGRQYQRVTDAIIIQRREVQDLQEKRERASTDAKRQLDAEIESLTKKINRQQDELITIDKKRAKLEEVGALATAQSDAEIAQIKAATDARITELDVIKNTQQAHRAVGEEINNTIPIGRNFFSVMGGFYVLNGVVNLAKDALAEVRKDIEGINAAAEKMRGIVDNQFNTKKSFFNEFGLTDAAGQRAADSAINNIASANNLTQENVASTAAGLAPALKAAGINDVNDPRFSDIVGQTAIMTNRGLDPTTTANFVAGLLSDHPGMTGAGINQQLTQLTTMSGGSASRANDFLSILSEDKERFKAAGLSTTDVEKMYGQLQRSGAPPQEIPQLFRSAFQSLDRLAGLGQEQQADLLEQLGEAGVHGLNGPISSAMSHGKQIDIRSIATALSSMSPDDRAKASRIIGGPRGELGLSSMAGWEGFQLPNAGTTGAPDAPTEIAKSLEEASDARTAAANPVDPYQARFAEDLKNEQSRIQKHPEERQWAAHGIGKVVTLNGLGMASTEQEQAAANIYGSQYMRLARTLNDIKTGKVSATPAQLAAVQKAMADIRGQMISAPGNVDQDAMEALDSMQAGTADKLLGGIDNDTDWFRKNFGQKMGYSSVPASIIDSTKAGPLMKEGDDAINAVSRPTTRPAGPSAATIHVRQINYGSSFDSIGASHE